MFIRVSHMRARAGQERRLVEVLEKLSAFYRDQPGYQNGYILAPYPAAPPEAQRHGRVGLWADQDSAEAAAQTEHGMALRADLNRIVEEDSHEELSFEGRPDHE